MLVCRSTCNVGRPTCSSKGSSFFFGAKFHMLGQDAVSGSPELFTTK